MPKLTTPENIQKRIEAAIDRKWFKRIFNERKLIFGNQAIGAWVEPSTGGVWPDYPDMVPDVQEVGTSKLILSAGASNLASIIKTFPRPVWNQVDKPHQIVREQFWQVRALGVQSGEPLWLDVAAKAWLDGYYHGRGIVQLGFKKNPVTGEDYITSQHIPLHRYVGDRSTRSATENRYEAYKHLIPLEDAVETFGSKVEKYKIMLRNSMDENTGEQMEVVPIIEYYDMGFGAGDPTRAYIPGDVDQDPLDVEAWEHPCLPSVVYEHMLLPGMRYPNGAITMLAAAQEAANAAERSVSGDMKRVGFDIASDAIDPDDIMRISAGEQGVIAKMTRPLNPGEQLHARVGGAEVSQTTLEALRIAKEDFVRLSYVNELRQGQSVQGANTLGEVELVDQRSQGGMGWCILQTLLFYRRWAEKFSMMAVYDTDPAQVEIEWNGKKANFTVNDPNDKGTWASEWFKEPSDIVLAESSLTIADTEREKTRKITQVMSLADLVQVGIVDPMKWAEERLKILGYEPSEWMKQQTEAPPMSPQMPGQMGQMGQEPGPGMKMPGAPPVQQSAIAGM